VRDQANTEDNLPPIDYDAAERMGDKLRWKHNPPEVSFSIKEDSDGELVLKRTQPEIIEIYDQMEQSKKRHAEKESIRNSAIANESLLRSLEVQEALVDPSHPFYAVLERVGENISQAERKIIERNGLSRTTLTEEYDFHLTRRENINAFTYPKVKSVYFESGLLVLMDHFLKNVKGYGLAEDHLALVLAHEISHSDAEAETGYLNEEYCDIQGMILGAEAGYNPLAAVDFEDFLIWLDEGNSAETLGEEEQGKNNLELPSHPKPKDRRLVLIDVLTDKNRSLPNQTKRFTEVDEKITNDLREQMMVWQETTVDRVLPSSMEKSLEQIKESNNVSELLDALTGHHVLQKSLITKEIANNPDLVNRLTIYQAIACEMKKKEEIDRVRFSTNENDNKMAADLATILLRDTSYDSFSTAIYDSHDLLIGGLASQLENSEIDQETKQRIDSKRTELLDELQQLKVGVSIKEKKNIPYKEQEKEREELLARSNLMTEQLRKVFQHLASVDLTEFNLTQFLSGDFSQDPVLGEMLRKIGIKNFDAYFSFINQRFNDLAVNPQVSLVLPDKSQKLMPQIQVLKNTEKNWSQEQIQLLLSETLTHRTAAFAEGAFVDPLEPIWKDYSQTVDNNQNLLRGLVSEKINELAKKLSDVPEEQILLAQLIEQSLIKGSRKMDELLIPEQLAASVHFIRENPDNPDSADHHQRHYPEKFQSDGLSKAIRQLKISPTHGGATLETYFSGFGKNLNYDHINRTRHRDTRNGSSRLGRRLDFVKLYYGHLIHDPETNWDGRSQYFRIKDKDISENLELLEARHKGVAIYGDQMNKPYLESRLEFFDDTDEVEQIFSQLKDVAKTVNYEPDSLYKIIFFSKISVEEKSSFLLGLLSNGDITLNKLNLMLQNPFRFPEENNLDRHELIRMEYEVYMSVLTSLPNSPMPQLSFPELNLLNQRLFDLYKIISEKDETQQDSGLESNEDGKLKDRLNLIFDFINDGGTVTISEKTRYEDKEVDWGDILNLGANVDLLGLIKKMDFPAELLSPMIYDLLEKNKDRFTAAERDKWLSLLAYCQQPIQVKNEDGFLMKWQEVGSSLVLESERRGLYKYRLTLSENGQTIELNCGKLDDLVQAFNIISQLPKSSYKDECLFFLSRLLNHSIDTVGPKGREAVEKLQLNILTNGLSDRALGIREKGEQIKSSGSLLSNKHKFVPASENFIGDSVVGFYLSDSMGYRMVDQLIHDYRSLNPHTALSFEYRQAERFQKMSAEEVESQILVERLSTLESMADSPLKEGLVLYSLRTSYENLAKINNSTELSQQLQTLIEKLLDQSESIQTREALFKMLINLETGAINTPLTKEKIAEHFPTRADFLNFITNAIPQKTMQRDTYILLAAEAYPLKVGDTQAIRELLFSSDYGTQEDVATKQRAGFQIGREMKNAERYQPSSARELIMWMIDEDLQVQSYDQLVQQLSANTEGRKLLKGLLNSLDFEADTRESNPGFSGQFETLATKTYLEILLRAPKSLKRKMLAKLIENSDVYIPQLQLAYLTRVGMPEIIQNSTKNFVLEGATFNSLIAPGSSENPSSKTMFFDLMLGEKGLLEEPINTNTEDFSERLENNFADSEMHKFIDDVVQMMIKKGGLNAEESKTMRVVAHSLLEAMSPTRRATVLYKLISEIKRIDFTIKDKKKLKSQILTLALGSFGVLGAKLGQIDEIVPKGWDSETGSLKHATEPMPLLAVADIFAQEGLSDNYQILSNAGAASTACGYMVRNPNGQEHFVKVVRPEVVLDWKEDFIAVEHMLTVLQQTRIIKTESRAITQQLKKLVEEELQTAREVDNVLQYVNVETEEARQARDGISAVKLAIDRISSDGETTSRPDNSLLIFAEPLGKAQGFMELSKIKNDESLAATIDLRRVNRIIIQDFLHRALTLGNWHSDLHEGNIMVNKEGVVQRRTVNNEDLVLIDFGQVGKVETAEKRANVARLLTGLGLFDRAEVAKAIHESLINKTGVSEATIKAQLSVFPDQLQDSALKLLGKYDVEEYMVNFLKASINVLPYFRSLPKLEQFNLIASYIPEESRNKIRNKIIARVSKLVNHSKAK
jgi:predicted unusual protein kinase regulating ubiquinone biosynthesis (AarF/ABC1/UbiB family)